MTLGVIELEIVLDFSNVILLATYVQLEFRVGYRATHVEDSC